MKANTIHLLQAIMVFLQIINASIGVSLHPPIMVAILISAAVGAMQSYLTLSGVRLDPNEIKNLIEQGKK